MLYLKEIGFFALCIFADTHRQIFTGRPGAMSSIAISVHTKSRRVKSINSHTTQVDLAAVILSPLAFTIPAVAWSIDICFLKIWFFSVLAESLIDERRYIFQSDSLGALIFQYRPYLHSCSSRIKLHMVLAFCPVLRSRMDHQLFSFFVLCNFMTLVCKIYRSAAYIMFICMHSAASFSRDLNLRNRIKIFRLTFFFFCIDPTRRVELFQFHHSIITNLKYHF